MNSWTFTFLRQWLPLVSLPSAMRLRRFVLADGKQEADFSVRLRGWGPVYLRGLGGGDYRMFDDMFRREMTPPVLPACKTLIDLGGNIGLATVALARELPELRSYVVEPDADNVRMLELNLKPLVDAGRCKIERGAMWKADQMIEVEPPPLPGSFGAVRCSERQGGGVQVRGMTMDTIIDRAGFERVDLMKVDVEGAEAGMFDAGSDWLDRVEALAVEFHGDARTACDFDRVAQRHGLRVQETHNRGVVAVRDKDAERLSPALSRA